MVSLLILILNLAHKAIAYFAKRSGGNISDQVQQAEVV
jgi:hypothetical protein